MSLDYYDKQDIERRIEKAHEQTRAEVKKVQREQQALAAAFKDVAKALTELTAEVKGLRADLNPELDKTVKLAAPSGAKP